MARAVGCRARLASALGDNPAGSLARAKLIGWPVDVVDLAPGAYELPVSSVLVNAASGERVVISVNAAGLDQPDPLPPALLRDAAVALVDGHIMSRAVEFAAAARTAPSANWLCRQPGR
ncbi:MAG: hypothetical protein LBG11_07890 [Bifidobacteriaceae bacterium]|nr:hypothetical protein [Bifidobacteriaceae bacterium]